VSTEVEPRPRLHRDPAEGILGGVLAGLGRRTGIDPVVLRVAFAVATVASGGLALIAYAAAWAVLPAEGAPRRSRRRQGLRLAAGWRVAVGAGLVTLAALLAFRELGIWWSDALVWPLVLAASGATLLWRQSRAGAARDEPIAAVGRERAPTQPEERRSRLADLYRGGFGAALVVGAALLFLSTNDALGAPRDVVLAALAALLALALILAPFLWRLGRNLATERAERIRSQERAELAAHLHDSVLQTLTLVQKRADDPRQVTQLARRQERELRSWLFDGRASRSATSLAGALETAAAEIEDAHGVPIEVVAVGDAVLDETGQAVVGAAREALTNAAKFAADSGPIAVYAEMSENRIQVFVRDRGEGFDPDAIPADRRGVRESIVGRMARHRGSAVVRSSPGGGTEVELAVEASRR
jgi:signal transduction histidine kinase